MSSGDITNMYGIKNVIFIKLSGRKNDIASRSIGIYWTCEYGRGRNKPKCHDIDYPVGINIESQILFKLCIDLTPLAFVYWLVSEIYMIAVWHFSLFANVESNGNHSNRNSKQKHTNRNQIQTNQTKERKIRETYYKVWLECQILGFAANNVRINRNKKNKYTTEKKNEPQSIGLVCLHFSFSRSSCVPCNQICITIEKDDITFRMCFVRAEIKYPLYGFGIILNLLFYFAYIYFGF